MTSEFITEFVHEPAGLSDCPALVLNADYLDRVTIVAEYERTVHSPTIEIRVPSVIVLKDYVKPAQNSAFTRFNLFLRDEFTCQYCGARGDMTFDHVVPRSKGGKTTWQNVVASCGPCNLRKGARSLEQASMQLRVTPTQPSVGKLLNAGRKFPPNYLHDSWMDFLYWDAELEEG